MIQRIRVPRILFVLIRQKGKTTKHRTRTKPELWRGVSYTVAGRGEVPAEPALAPALFRSATKWEPKMGKGQPEPTPQKGI